MARYTSLARYIHRTFGFGKNTKNTKSIRSLAPMMITAAAILAAVVFSVSVESRSGGWLRRTQPSTPPTTPEVAKNSTSRSNAVNPKRTVAANPMLAPFAPTVTATKTDTLLTDVDMDGKADPGDTLKYTVTIGATGMDAEGVTFTDTVDPNTAFVAGTLRTTPLARADSYTATGNVRIQVPAPGVLANDADPDAVGPAISVTAGTFLSAQGGNVSISADGSFSYNPKPGFEGSDSFTYTLNDNEAEGNNTDTGTVSITVSGMIWFIDNNFGGTSDGRLTNPFKTLAGFQAVNDGGNGGLHPSANDKIFVYESATDYVGPVTLLSGQWFIGQDAAATFTSIFGAFAPNSDPQPSTNSGNGTIVNITSAGSGINLGSNNTVRGFTGGNAAPDIFGSGFGTAAISDITLNGTGQALDLTNGTLSPSATFGSISSTNSAATGISLTTVAGGLTTGSTTVTNPSGVGISVNTSSANLNFANASVTLSGGTGVSLTTNTGTITFADLDISPDANQRGLLATDNTNTITTNFGTITTSGAAGVEISRASGGNTPLAVALDSVSTTGGPNGIFLKNTSGSFSVNGDGLNTAVGGNFTGGTISGMVGANGATAGNGVYLENASMVTLRRIRINGTNQNNGIRGLNFSNFTLEFSTINGTNGDDGANDESAVQFDNLTGTAAITSCILDGGFEDNLNLVNTSGTLNRLTISGTTFGFNSSAGGNNNITIDAQGASTTLNFTLKSSLIKGSHIDWMNASANTSATMDAVIGGPLVADGNNFDNLGANAAPVQIPNGNRLVTGSIGNMTLDIRNNTLKGSLGEAIRVRSSANGAITGTMNARVRNNTIGVAATANSGSTGGSGIFVFGDGGSDMNVAVTNNSVFQYNQSGIMLQFGDEINNGAVYNATVTGNTVNTPGTLLNNFNGIQLNNGTIAATDDFTSCVDVGGAGVGNNVAASGKGAAAPNNSDIRLRQRQSTTVQLPGYVGPVRDNSDGDVAEVGTYLLGRNTANTANGNSVSTGGGFIGGAACTAPSFAGPITSSATSESLSAASDDRPDNILFATKGQSTSEQQVVKLSQSELSAMVQAAIARWAEAGISAKNAAKLQALSYEVADLPDGQLATANANQIVLDETAAGYGWFFDATPSDDSEFAVPVLNKELQTTELSDANGRVDLLTALMRQMGAAMNRNKSALKGPQSWLMESTLDTGTRRAPVLKAGSVGKAPSVQGANANAKSTVAQKSEKRDAKYEQVASLNAPRSARVTKHHATLAPRVPTSFADVMLSIGVLPAGKSITITFNVTVDNPFTGASAAVCNQGTVTGTNFSSVSTDDPSVGGAADATCTDIDLQADLQITAKTDAPDPVVAGTNLTYTINFINNGPNAANASVTDATPAGTTFVSAAVTSGTGWGVADPGVGNTGNVVFTKGVVTNGETATFQIVVKVGAGVADNTIITNNAVAATTNATDPVPGNNTGTATTTVDVQADLTISKSDAEDSAVPGEPIIYTITVSNAGPSNANGVSVADTFPPDLTGVSFTSVASPGVTGNTAAGVGNISDTVNMPAGSNITYTVNATIKSSATGSLTNTATVTAPAGVTDPNTANNTSTDTDTLTPQADLSITKTDGVTTAVPGNSVTYTITVTNNGPSDAPGTSVTDTFPGTVTVSYTSVASGSATGNTAGPAVGNINDTLSMPAGSSVTYTAIATIAPSATGSLSNTASVAAGAGVTDVVPGNNSANDTDTLTPQANLAITKTDGVASAVPGTSVTYTITVTNNGPSNAPGTTIADTFPGTVTVSYSSVASGGATGNTAGPAVGNINDIVSMPVGSSVTYTANAAIASSATGSLSNTATVTPAGSVTDPTPGNNTANDTDTLTPQANVAVTKTDSPDPVQAGSNITYTITVTNTGPSDAQSLSFSDAIPTGTTFVSVNTPAGWTRTDGNTGGEGPPATITFTRASFAANASASVFTLVVNVPFATANGTIITNNVSVSTATFDTNTGNNTASATTTVQSCTPPVVTASVSITQLPQNSHDLINVGLAASTSGLCTPTITSVQVFGDEDDQTPTNGGTVFSPDAKDIAVGTLRLRGERTDSGNGRVYLIVVTATNTAGQTGFATVTVVVPKSNSPANVAAVNAEAAAAKSFADSNGGAPPPGYFVIGDGPIIGNKQ